MKDEYARKILEELKRLNKNIERLSINKLDKMKPITYENIAVRHWFPYETGWKYSAFHNIGDMYFFNIEDSLHYHCLETNEFLMYDAYVTYTEQKEHSADIYKNLIENFDIEKMDPIRILWNRNINKWDVHDGTHRISILKHRGYELKDEYFKII
jgi:hypothetical protein